jgi:hypothetical protein
VLSKRVRVDTERAKYLKQAGANVDEGSRVHLPNSLAEECTASPKGQPGMTPTRTINLYEPVNVV